MGGAADQRFTGRRVTADLCFGLVLLVAGIGMVALLASGGTEDVLYLLAVSALVLASGVALLVVDTRRARTVSASLDGLRLTDALGRQRLVPWATLRRVRTLTERGFPGRDEHLDLVDGELVTLPPRLPDGSIERWREELSVPEPPSADPPSARDRVWRIPVRKVPSWVGLLQLPNLVFLLSGPWAGYSLVLLVPLVLVLAVVVGISYRRDRREVRADPAGLTLPRFRGPRRLAWTDVVNVGGTSGRWDDDPRLELRDGTTVPLPLTVPASVVARWRDELAPSST